MKERLRYQQFTRQREQGQLALALVGMSNVGKSLWAGRLAESGFSVYGCDAEIEQQLAPELLNHGYMGGLAEVARWMGQPYAPQFAANQQRYLQLEAKALQSKLGQIVGRGKVQGVIGQSNIRIVVANEGALEGEAHSAIEER